MSEDKLLRHVVNYGDLIVTKEKIDANIGDSVNLTIGNNIQGRVLKKTFYENHEPPFTATTIKILAKANLERTDNMGDASWLEDIEYLDCRVRIIPNRDKDIPVYLEFEDDNSPRVIGIQLTENQTEILIAQALEVLNAENS